MVTISITAKAFAAIEATLLKGSKAEARPDEGGLLVTLDRPTLDRLKALRGAGESDGDAIPRIARDM